MAFRYEVLSGFLANMAAGMLLVVFYVVIQWALRATDLKISYSWRFEGTINAPRNLRPAFDIRNRSGSRTYVLGNVAYIKDRRPIAAFDNKSVWDKELRPGTITFLEAAPVNSFTSMDDCLGAEVHLRLQNGREFWLKGQGPGQQKIGRTQRIAFWLRDKLESSAVPME